MIPAAFEYSRAHSVDEALGLLSQHAGSAKLIAGGHSLLPLLKLRVASVERLIDIGKLSELRGIRAGSGGGLTFGALTTYRDVLESAEVRSQFPVLIDATPDVPWQEVIHVMDLCKKEKLERIEFAAPFEMMNKGGSKN